jgi:hypothetical protein
MTEIIKTPLNRYMVEMVKPDECIKRGVCSWEQIPSIRCNNCFLSSGDFCVYEKVIVDYSKGSYETNYKHDKPREWNFEQFCCPNCGELISEHSTRHISWTDKYEIKCEKCKSEFICLKDDYINEKLTLARKPI